MYRNILVIASETQSPALDMSTRGRNMAVLFGDGAGAAVVSRSEGENGILSTHLHSEGAYADALAMIAPGVGTKWVPEILAENDPDDVSYYPNMNGQFVFKNAVVRFAEVIEEGLKANGLSREDINMLIPHQANLRISQFVQHQFKLTDEQIFNNILSYVTSPQDSIRIAITEEVHNAK